MKRRITRIEPLQAGKMLGVVQAGMALLFVPFFALAAIAGAFAQSARHTQNVTGPPAALMSGIMIAFGLFMPVMCG